MSDIPVEHGLGSSTTAVIVGIKIANALGDLKLSIDDQMQIANKMERHSENVAAGFLGELTVSQVHNEKLTAIKTKMPDISALMFIMPRGKVGKIELPTQIDSQTALANSNDANLLLAALMTDNWPVASTLIEGRYFGEQNLKRDQDNLDLIQTAAHALGIYGTFISGSGPVIVSLGKRDELIKLRDQLRTDKRLEGKVRVMALDREGATVRGE
nr:homoserine kinase [Lactobacillus sp. Sy-1]